MIGAQFVRSVPVQLPVQQPTTTSKSHNSSKMQGEGQVKDVSHFSNTRLSLIVQKNLGYKETEEESGHWAIIFEFQQPKAEASGPPGALGQE